LSDTVKHFSMSYVQFYNRKYERSGTLWNERHDAVTIKDERQLLTCLMYIERNPVAAHVVVAAENYRWSSYRLHALGISIPWLSLHEVYRGLGATPADRQAVYRALFDAMNCVDLTAY